VILQYVKSNENLIFSLIKS